MSADMLYGGDDIGALVFDVGHYSLRVGHAQDSTPKAEIPAIVGISEETESFPCFDEDEKWLDGKQNPFDNNGKKYYVDTNFVHVAKERMELLRYMKDGMIHDWDLFEKVLDYAYERVIQSEPHFHPVLMSEASWNEAEKREKLTEIMFEKYNVPAFFLAKNSVLAAFANGRTTGIVVDSGATHTSAVPVEDGFVLKRAIVRSPIGGDYITSLCETFLKEKVGVQIIPSYLISTKETVKEREKPLWTRKKHVPEVTSSWHEYMEFKVVQDFQMSVLQVCETPFDARVVATVPAAHYEFPDGYHQEFGAERFSIAEALFAPGAVPAPALALVPAAAAPAPITAAAPSVRRLGAADVVAASVRLCDVDARHSLYGSVIVTGGNTLLQGFTERLTHELSLRAPSSVRLKVLGAKGAAERRFAAWIGGSILASLATFKQMWVSQQEYEEGGKGQIGRKCP